MSLPKNTSAAVFGVLGTRLNAEEKAFFSDIKPLGFILFKRNCENREQVKALVAEMHELTGRDALPILIDQEGGRVMRLQPPEWRKSLAAGALAALSARSIKKTKRAIYLNSRLIASELAELGITVNCLPVLDIPVAGAHEIISDRALGTEPKQIVTLGREMVKGLLEGGVLPIMKHMPGHGRATVDSHDELPVVDTPLDELERTDFVPFRKMNDLAMGMTAHVIYTALDAENVATTSPTVIRYIREKIGFDGLLFSDDLSMKALKGSFQSRTEDSLKAGCDVVLHCNGKLEEMRPIAEKLPPLTEKARARAKAAMAQLHPPQPLDIAAAEQELQSLLG